MLFVLMAACMVNHDLYNERYAALADEDGDGYSIEGGDCDDSDSAVAPNADEVCDGIDNNCDGTIDEDDAVDAVVWYRDQDGDGYGDPDVVMSACEAPEGHVALDSDCDDSNATVYPGAEETWENAITDNDCDGEREPIIETFGQDAIIGTEPDAQFGRRIHAIGDIDDDGLAEFAVSAPYSSDIADYGGAVYILDGMGGDEDVDFPRIVIDDAYSFLNSTTDSFDVTSDGIPDLLVATSGGDGRGAVHLISGASLSDMADSNWVADIEMFHIDGDEAGAYFGTSAFLGDIDGDGLMNIGAGSNLATPQPDLIEAGKVGIWNQDTFDSGTVADADWLIEGYFQGQQLGARIQAAGDIDGDGYDDFLLAGAGVLAQVLPGGVTSPSSETDAIFQLYKSTESEVCGVKMLGDIDGDGFRDLGCVRTQESFQLFTNLRGLGALVTDDATVNVSFSSDSYSFDILDLGDLDGDSKDDTLLPIMMDSRLNAPSAAILFGEQIIVGNDIDYNELPIEARCNRIFSDYGYRVLVTDDTTGDDRRDLLFASGGDDSIVNGGGGVVALTLPQ